jgi:hypothetical protein
MRTFYFKNDNLSKSPSDQFASVAHCKLKIYSDFHPDERNTGLSKCLEA